MKDASEAKSSEENSGEEAQPNVRFFAMDEARFGLKVWHRRCWCPKGHRPPWIVEDRYEWTWLYAAIEPATGESFCLYMRNLDGLCLEVFLQELRKAYPDDDEIILVMDGAGGHRNKSVQWPEGIDGWRLPAYSPELNPVERWFRELREPLANRIFETVEAIEEALNLDLRHFVRTGMTSKACPTDWISLVEERAHRYPDIMRRNPYQLVMVS